MTIREMLHTDDFVYSIDSDTYVQVGDFKYSPCYLPAGEAFNHSDDSLIKKGEILVAESDKPKKLREMYEILMDAAGHNADTEVTIFGGFAAKPVAIDSMEEFIKYRNIKENEALDIIKVKPEDLHFPILIFDVE